MLKFIFNNIKDYKKSSILTPIFVILEVGLSLSIPYLMSLVIDNAVLKEDGDYLKKIIGFLFIIALLNLFASLLSSFFATTAAAGLAKNIRVTLFKHINTFSFKNIDAFNSGTLVSRLTTDVQFIQIAFQMSIRMGVRAPLTLVFSFIMSFKLSPNLAPYFLLIIPIISTGMLFIMWKAYPLFKKSFDVVDRINTIVSENLSGIRVVKSFVKEDKEIKKFNGTTEKLYYLYLGASKYIALTMPIMQFSTYLISMIIAWFGAKLVVNASITTGILTSLIAYSIQIQISLMMLSMLFIQIVLAKNAQERISEVLQEKSTMNRNLNGVKTIESGNITFNNVRFSFLGDEDKCVLKDINLEIAEGDYVGIIGPTGSGKSTLVNLIPRLYDTLRGDVFISGVNVKDYDIKALRDEVSVVLQKNQLFTGTIRENLKWADENLTDDELINDLKIANAYDFVTESKGLDAEVQRGGTNFSGGQKQRLCIARAILKNPKILIMDDSTSALDNTTEKNIINSLNKLMPSMTKILISQRVNSLINCDYIIVLNKGHIENIGTHEELLNNSTVYREIFNSQQKTGDFDE